MTELVTVKGIVDIPQDEVAVLLEGGYLLMELGKWKEAQEVFSGVTALIPHSDVPHMALGNLFFAQGKFAQALKNHREALAVRPDSALARAHVGETLLFMKKYEEARAELEKTLAQEPEGPTAAFARSLLEAHDVGCFDKV
jgi:tetratricopeptide (TPR) repeat protein